MTCQNKKYSHSVWKEKLWEQIGEELKKSVKFQLRILKLTAHVGVTVILLSPKF
jgi:hypothetical protein